MKLVIADDEDSIRNGIIKYVQLHTDRFAKIIPARNGEELLEILYRDRPDILCLDIQMPLVTGTEVMEEASKTGVLPYTIVLSGYGQFEYCQKAIRCGAKDYLLKPVRSSDLLEKLLYAADAIAPVETRDEELAAKRGVVERALDYMEENYYKNLRLVDVAEKVGISAGYLSTLISRSKGKVFVDLLNEIRVDRACRYLDQGYLKTYEIAYKVGFQDEKYFSKVFKKIKGISPSKYKSQDGFIEKLTAKA
ncbi:response regulator transcription factor [Butyrivibrio sp. MC2013]|uniref:response regulator transcription factor n=1 Tax=Butyrivibrio sp. MC2013 TaxID=1280686 RepID=UPI00042568EE|nr:response regulator [Butyrivibrio sp. MC2013]